MSIQANHIYYHSIKRYYNTLYGSNILTIKNQVFKRCFHLRSDNTVNNNSIFNTKHAEISIKWYVVLLFSRPCLFIQAPLQFPPTVPSSSSANFQLHISPPYLFPNHPYNFDQHFFRLYFIHFSHPYFQTQPTLQSPPITISSTRAIQPIQALSRAQ